MIDDMGTGADKDYNIKGRQLWGIMVALLTFDEFLAVRAKSLSAETNYVAMLHLAQNKLIVNHIVSDLHKLMNSNVTEDEKQRLEDFMKKLRNDM